MRFEARARLLLPYFAMASVVTFGISLWALVVQTHDWFLPIAIPLGMASGMLSILLLIDQQAAKGRLFGFLRWMLSGIPRWARMVWLVSVVAALVTFLRMVVGMQSSPAGPTETFEQTTAVYSFYFSISATLVAWATVRKGAFGKPEGARE